eukprot:5893829-Prymnesium_polylepis.1
MRDELHYALCAGCALHEVLVWCLSSVALSTASCPTRGGVAGEDPMSHSALPRTSSRPVSLAWPLASVFKQCNGQNA